MKKCVLTIFLLTMGLCSFAQNSYESVELQNVIHLDSSTQQKEYKLEKPDLKNNHETLKDEEDMSVPVDFISGPLRMLKQYQTGEF